MPGQLPKNIVLATDLSPRSDRALDRSFALAQQWDAQLTIAHAIEFQPYHKDVPSWRRGPDRIETIRNKLVDEFIDEELLPKPAVVVEEGRPEKVVLDLAQKRHADLIVTGVAHFEPLGRKILGNTVNTLMRKADCSVLAVKKRLRKGYRHVVVGLDLSEFSKKALLTAISYFPDAKITILHAVPVAFRGRAANPEQYAKAMCDEARVKAQDFLDEALGKEGAQRYPLVVDEGNPAWLLADYVSDMNVDLVVIGTHGETGLLSNLLGSAATSILEAVSCDVLVVR